MRGRQHTARVSMCTGTHAQDHILEETLRYSLQPEGRTKRATKRGHTRSPSKRRARVHPFLNKTGGACARAREREREQARTRKAAREAASKTYRQEWEINQSISPGLHRRASRWVSSVGFGLLLFNKSKEILAQSIQNNDPVACCTNCSGVIVPPSGMSISLTGPNEHL